MSGPALSGDLDLERLQQTLETRRYGRTVGRLEQTGSTNDDARAAILAGAERGHMVIAETQTAGRGSRGRTWQSPPGVDLYLSIIDRLPVSLAHLPPLTLAIGLAAAETADALLGSAAAGPVEVKWPNDVLIQGRKCAGILVEASSGLASGDWVVIGIGLNVNRTEFSAELALATSLRASREPPAPLDRTLALKTLLERVEARVDAFVAEGAAATVAALTPRLALRGQRARCDQTEGIVRGVAATGALLFETDHGLKQIIAGRLTRA